MCSSGSARAIWATLLVSLCFRAKGATNINDLRDSAGNALVKASSCTTSPCLQGVAYAAGYLAGCQVRVRHFRTEQVISLGAYVAATLLFTFAVDTIMVQHISARAYARGYVRASPD